MVYNLGQDEADQVSGRALIDQVSGRGAGTGCWATSPVIADGPASPIKLILKYSFELDFEIKFNKI